MVYKNTSVELLPGEELKDIKNTNGVCEISNFGRVWSNKLNRFLTLKLDRGYVKVIFFVNGKQKSHRVHRLVAEYFCNGFTDYCEVGHSDGIRTNNYFTNLCCITKQDNLKDRYFTGRYKIVSFIENYSRKYKIKNVSELVDHMNNNKFD